MKTTIFALSLSALSLFQSATAQPYGHQRFHKRVEMSTEYTTVTAPEVIVWVYENGQTASVEIRTPGIPAATPAPASVESESTAEAITTSESSTSEETAPSQSPVRAYEESSTVEETAPQPTYEASSSPEFAPPREAEAAPSPIQHSTPPSGLGICYSPYNSDGTCKSQDQVNSDFNSLTPYSTVRIYGVDCNQITTVTKAAAAKGIKIFAGLLTISNVASDLSSLISQLHGDFSSGIITTISIGNELVDMGKASVGDVVAALGTARDILGKAGFTGSIVTVDTFNALIAHPELCQASDYCAANAHSFFDPTIEPSGAGKWVERQIGRIAASVGDASKKVVITESGWPHAGQSNGLAVPSQENQATAIESIRKAFDGKGGVFLFCAFDDKWKNDGAFGVEKNWGIM